jgi:type IV pilus assembly protein PilC
MTTMTEPPVEDASSSAEPENAPRFRALMNLELTPKKIKRRELMHFSRQMAVFIKAGIPVIEALETISGEVKNKFFKTVLDDAAANLRAGSTFAGAFEAHEPAFPPYYMGILRSAELTGQLDHALDQLADYVDRDLEARRKIVAALTYPTIVAAMAVVVVIVLVAFVLPRFKHFFSDLGAKLPLPTRMLLSFTDFTQNYWWIFVILAALLFGLVLWLTQTDKGRFLRDRMVLRTPALGDLVQTAVLERFCRILSSMTSSGVPLTEALQVTAQATSNVVYRNGISDARQAMIRGEGLAAPLGQTGLFPAAARQMLRVGEDTGTMDEQLGTAAEYFARDLDYKIKRFTNLFEPAVILFVGVIVGFVAIALVSAMYGIFHQVHP